MTILVTGSTGNTSSRVASLLHAASHPFLITTRKDVPSVEVPALTHPKTVPAFQAPAVRFDWTDESTYGNPFDTAPIKAVYMVAPSGIGEPAPIIKKFIDYAMSRGVKRFVVLSATVVPEGGPFIGPVHEYLHHLGDEGKVEWGVLRPTWFMQNFAEQAPLRDSIKTESKIYTATGSGRVPFVDCGDIAHVAYHALTSTEPPNRDFIITGPELLSYSDCATVLSKEVGRTITHVQLDYEARKNIYMSVLGLPADYADMMTGLETLISKGGEEGWSNCIESITGIKPRLFIDFVKQNQLAW